MTWLAIVKRAASLLFDHSEKSNAATTIPVGTGAHNERQFFLNGIPHLLRDEGNCIVHFVARFEYRMESTAYGEKLLPDVVPRWVPIDTHALATLEGVAASVMKLDGLREAQQGPGSAPGSDKEVEGRRAERRDLRSGHRTERPRDACGGAATEVSPSTSTTVGNLLGWGEMEFPSRKARGPRTYRSFAVKLATPTGEQTLQGEGLKEAIAKAMCRQGDHVVVKRLRKVKVPAFDEKTGRPIIDRETGEQKLWDKWIWEINQVH
ncbi:hypothetical protein L602_001500001130 [Cupriavidus gilardii J11]|uniref:Uncharacterized protein n=1 Tax=Cupriavidus gilardii J11 TaxID=936133 RepID=A0A562BT61_9BURK|nr:hypothetical protein [Cupriavidus gilardii]TWG87980.1 hypothetical protein L602_001500001130 [Cupriavidus gilardii J11]